MLSNYKLQKIEKNLEYFYNESTEQNILDGFNWYGDANKFCSAVAAAQNIDIIKVASVLSALSPRNKWEQNKKDTIKTIEAFKNGMGPDDIKVCTFHSNKRKAFDILNDQKTIGPDACKTFAFLQNIAYLNSNFVTIDVWHLRACFNKMILKKSVTPSEYRQIENVTIKLAKKYSITGFQFQAIVWEQIRNNY